MALREPLNPAEARRLIQAILAAGEVVSSSHANNEMAADGLDLVDCITVLRSGVVEPGEFAGGTWRYRVRARDVCAVVAFRSVKRLVIVTAWRVRT